MSKIPPRRTTRQATTNGLVRRVAISEIKEKLVKRYQAEGYYCHTTWELISVSSIYRGWIMRMGAADKIPFVLYLSWDGSHHEIWSRGEKITN